MNEMRMFEAAGQDETLISIVEDVTEEPEPPRRDRRLTDFEQVKRHLESGESITPKVAFDRYGISVGSLYGSISKLRNDELWHIETRFYRDETGRRASEYTYIGNSDQQQENMIQNDTPEQAKAVAPVTVNETRIANIRMGVDGPELLLVGDGESDTRPFYKLSSAQVKYLSLNLALFVEMSENR